MNSIRPRLLIILQSEEQSMRTHSKKISLQKEYALTPWNHEDFQEERTNQQVKKLPKTASNFFKKTNPSELEKNSSYSQLYKQRKERLTQNCEREQPLLAKTFTLTFDSQPSLRTLTTERLKRDLQSFASQLTSRSSPKCIVNLKLKNMSKSKTAKQLRNQFINMSQRNSQASESIRSTCKRQTIVRSHNNFFQGISQRVQSKNRTDSIKKQKIFFPLRRNVIKDSDLRVLIRKTESAFLNNQT